MTTALALTRRGLPVPYSNTLQAGMVFSCRRHAKRFDKVWLAYDGTVRECSVLVGDLLSSTVEH